MLSDILLKGLGFEQSKRKSDINNCVWILRYPTAPGGVIKVRSDWELPAVIGAIFDAGVKAGKLRLASEIRDILPIERILTDNQIGSLLKKR